jgi:hypothetical protein
MATTARYTAQMIVLERPDLVGEINAYSIKSNIPKSELLRDALVNKGWRKLRDELRAEYGELTAEERRYGTLTALPPTEREAYAATHGLDWGSPLCQVSRDGRGRPPMRAATADAAAGAE